MNKHHYLPTLFLTVLILTLGYISLFLYQLNAPVKAGHWLRNVYVVKNYIAQNLESPKVITVGGSNALFGINSAMIESAMGIRAVNFASLSTFPIQYHIYKLKKILNRGDTVILALEFNQYELTTQYNTQFVNDVMAWDTDFFWSLILLEKIKFILSVSPKRIMEGVLSKVLVNKLDEATRSARRSSDPALIMKLIKNHWTKNFILPNDYSLSYDFRNLNKYGDTINNFGSFLKEDINDYGLSNNFFYSPTTWKTLTEFKKYCHNKNIKLFITWSPTAINKALDFNKKITQKKIDEIIANIKTVGIEILGEPNDFNYEKEFFFDTYDHLNNRGRNIRTKKILELLGR